MKNLKISDLFTETLNKSIQLPLSDGFSRGRIDGKPLFSVSVKGQPRLCFRCLRC